MLYTYSLIIALVCGTAGLPHILVRFYTNPDGVAAKRTTMWVMILIGTFYVFPPVFGVMGRNLLPELYAATGAKGTDKVVLELPRVLDRDRGAELAPAGAANAVVAGGVAGETAARRSGGGVRWGSVLSGITCAGAFAAFMSTFSGLLVSMTGALAHDIYGRILRPGSTATERMRMFKVLPSYSTALSVSVIVPQMLSSEKSSSRRTSPVWTTGTVAVGRGGLVLVGREMTVSVGGGNVAVA